MEIEKILNAEQLTYQSETGEQNFYVLPDEAAVEKLLSTLREKGLSDTIQLSLSGQSQAQAKQKKKEYDTLLDDMAARLQAIPDTTMTDPLHKPSDNEQLADKEYLTIYGDQEVYVLPNDFAVEQVLSKFTGLKTGEVTQSQMWHTAEIKTDSQEQSELMEKLDARFEELDKKIQRLESLLNRVVGREL